MTELDLYRDIALDAPYQAYAPLLECLFSSQRTARFDAHERNNCNYSWELSGNTDQQFCAYDKSKQLQETKRDGADLPPHIMRVEWRIARTRKIRTVFTLDDGHEVSFIQILNKYASLENLYEEALRKHVFRDSTEDLVQKHTGNGGSRMQKRISVFARYVNRTTDFTLPVEDMLSVWQTEGIRTFLHKIRKFPGISPRYRSNAIREMITAALQDLVSDAGFAKRYCEMRRQLLSDSLS